VLESSKSASSSTSYRNLPRSRIVTTEEPHHPQHARRRRWSHSDLSVAVAPTSRLARVSDAAFLTQLEKSDLFTLAFLLCREEGGPAENASVPPRVRCPAVTRGRAPGRRPPASLGTACARGGRRTRVIPPKKGTRP